MADLEVDEVAAELEALSFMYPELASDASSGDDDGSSGGAAAAGARAPAYSIDLGPRGAPPPRRFVAARLRLAAPAGYPSAPARVALRDVRGLGDARRAGLLARLEAEASELAGGPALGRLVELCEQLLGELNAPEGGGAVCGAGAAALLWRTGAWRSSRGADAPPLTQAGVTPCLLQLKPRARQRRRTPMPSPAGPCTVCLCDMEAPAAGAASPATSRSPERGGGAPPPLTRLPCYHSFHT
jgi:hypothetical protein